MVWIIFFIEIENIIKYICIIKTLPRHYSIKIHIMFNVKQNQNSHSIDYSNVPSKNISTEI